MTNQASEKIRTPPSQTEQSFRRLLAVSAAPKKQQRHRAHKVGCPTKSWMIRQQLCAPYTCTDEVAKQSVEYEADHSGGGTDAVPGMDTHPIENYDMRLGNRE